MPKQAANINFSEGLDTKTDPKQVRMGKFLKLENTVFNKGGLLEKRNGFSELPPLQSPSSYVTTFNGDLTAIGSEFQALPTGSGQWTVKGPIQPIKMDTLPLVRNNFNQSQSDSALSQNNLVCTVYTENDGTSNSYKYVVADSKTGQNIVPPAAITDADPTTGTPRVFLLGKYFVIIYTNKVGSTYNLKAFAILISNPIFQRSIGIISALYAPSADLSFDGAVLNDALYLAWNGSSASGVRMAYLTSSLVISSAVIVDASHVATSMSVTADFQNNVVWANYYDSVSTDGYAVCISTQIGILPNFPTQTISSVAALNITASAQSGTCTVFYEVSNTDNSVITNYVSSVTVDQMTGSVSAPDVVIRSVGLASKSFIINETIYFLSSYSSDFQPTYFLINGSTSHQALPVVVAKLAYENGNGYLSKGLPTVSVIGTTASIAYLYKDLIEALNNSNDAGTQVKGGVYSQTGINLVSFNFTSQGLVSAEIGTNLNTTGGFLGAYDGYLPVEQGFHLWPEPIQVIANSTTGGSMSAQPYFYQATYEWTDNQGNAFRSAGSIPIEFDFSSSMTSTNQATLVIPTLRLTYKVANPVKIVLYRWSVAQQTFYQTTSITAPIVNDTTADSITYVDKHSDASIVGNNILYTTGGVVENIGGPAFKSVFLFDDRLFGITSEDQNLLWFSKQVIESTPVEMSDLLTIYVAPNIGAQGPSGKLNCGFPLDDKAILFKDSSILYFNGTGPDNTGSNSQYSQPVIVTSTVGCSNQNSIAFIPEGLIFEFQSASGNQIWLLGRDLSTQFIGAPVTDFTANASVQSVVNVPGTNEVRFSMSSGVVIYYDYFYNQWGSFTGIPSLSSTLYQGLHTFIDQYGRAFQESPGSYLDGGNPVLISFTTGWINLSGLRGYERIHEFSFLGTYLSPHKLAIQTAYDYGSPFHQSIYEPKNFSPPWGEESVWGSGSAWGGPSNIENFRVFAKRQKCKAFQISLQELYDPSFGVAAGAGLSLSGINLVMTLKKGWAPVSGSHSVG